MSERKVTRYVCGCVLAAVVQRDEQGLKIPPYPPLNCPVHSRIWEMAYTAHGDTAHDALESPAGVVL